MKNKVELLAPAGTLEKLKIAIYYGADAVYIAGDQFGLRRAAGNFTFQEMCEGVDYAHKYAAKVYVAANMIAHNEDISVLEKYLFQLGEAGIDGIIFADPVVYMVARRIIPHIPLHVSTQMSTTNWQAVDLWRKKGIKRVVLGRESSLAEVKEISSKVDIEIETFVHGAMCVSYSGKCLLSNYMARRDANRGGCAQSCRWSYHTLNTNGNSDRNLSKGYGLMNSYDLSMINHVGDLIEAGVSSFKIEGRMKSLHYVATVVNSFRQAIDKYYQSENIEYKLDSKWLTEIEKASHRPVSNGFYYDKPSQYNQMYASILDLRKYDFVGLVLAYDAETKLAKVQQRNNFKIGDLVEVVGPHGVYFEEIVSSLYNEEGVAIDVAPHPLETVFLEISRPVEGMYLIRKKIN